MRHSRKAGGRGIHRRAPSIAGFAAAFVESVIRKAVRDGRPLTVLGPFAGVATTLVEAMRLGHDSVGFERNPYAALAARVKGRIARLSGMRPCGE